jgi:single-strand DNA-binding protein
MSRGVNKVIAIGNLGKDPETRYMPSGVPVTSFSIAVSEQWKDKQTGEQRERTEWINVEVWGNTAEACQKYLSKGSQCYIEGKLQTDKWEKDGVTRYTTKVRADTIQFLGSPRDGRDMPSARSESGTSPTPTASPQKEFDDDIPF